MRRDRWHDEGALRTLYFGGGTPSRLDPAVLGELISELLEWHGSRSDIEITLETNPDDVTPSNARRWASAGINRISLGVQSHHAEVLKWMHRTHRAEQVAPAIGLLREVGINNISLDLIFALPVALKRDWSRDLALSLALEPQHLSLYGLTVEPRTPLGRWVARGESVPAPDELWASQYLLAHDQLLSHGFEHYEVSNAALPGYYSRHNSSYWEDRNYLGLGPSAHSRRGSVRSWNTSAWVEWAALLSRGIDPQAGSELIQGATDLLERRYLGLRTGKGVSQDLIPDTARLQWERQGWAECAGGCVRLTPEGWLRLDALVAELPDP